MKKIKIFFKIILIKKIEEYITKLILEYPDIKYSTEYLNDRVQENKFSKQKRYKVADQRKIIND